MAKTGKIVYVTQAQYSSLVNDGSITVGGVTYTYNADNTYCVREEGGGGSGDVTASGTLSVGSVITGLGSKTVAALNGTNGKFLGWSGGATWQGLYMHTIRIAYDGDASCGRTDFYFLVISTQSTAYTDIGDIPDGQYVATGIYTDLNDSNTVTRVIYVNTSLNSVCYFSNVYHSMSAATMATTADIVVVSDSIVQIL